MASERPEACYVGLRGCACPADDCGGTVEYGHGRRGHSCDRCMRSFDVDTLVRAAFMGGIAEGLRRRARKGKGRGR